MGSESFPFPVHKQTCEENDSVEFHSAIFKYVECLHIPTYSLFITEGYEYGLWNSMEDL